MHRLEAQSSKINNYNLKYDKTNTAYPNYSCKENKNHSLHIESQNILYLPSMIDTKDLKLQINKAISLIYKFRM